MFDLRYHVASLAAVFVALLIGILVGVAMSGKVDDAEKRSLASDVNRLEAQLDAARERRANGTREQKAFQVFVRNAYPALIADRLSGKRIAIVFVGPVDPAVRRDIQRAIEDAGASAPVRIRALKVPVDPQRIDGELDGADVTDRARSLGAPDVGAITADCDRAEDGNEGNDQHELEQREDTPVGIDMFVDAAVDLLEAFLALESGILDVQAEVDDRGVALDEVGIDDLAYPVVLAERDGGVQQTVGQFELVASLPAELRGTHMSRFVEILHEWREDIAVARLPSLLSDLAERTATEEVLARFAFQLFLERSGPASGG